MNTIRLFSSAVVLAGLLGLSACVSLLPEQVPVSVYRLSSPEAREWRDGDGQVVEIESPQAPRGLGGAEIALVRGARSLAYIQGARWIAPTTHMIQNLVIETFNAADTGLAPTRPEDGTRADYSLRLDLREFVADYDRGDSAAPLIRVTIAARLIEGSGRQMVAAQVFSAEARAGAHSTRSIVAAFDEASNRVAGDLAAWTGDRAARATAEAEARR